MYSSGSRELSWRGGTLSARRRVSRWKGSSLRNHLTRPFISWSPRKEPFERWRSESSISRFARRAEAERSRPFGGHGAASSPASRTPSRVSATSPVRPAERRFTLLKRCAASKSALRDSRSVLGDPRKGERDAQRGEFPRGNSRGACTPEILRGEGPDPVDRPVFRDRLPRLRSPLLARRSQWAVEPYSSDAHHNLAKFGCL